MSYNFTSSAKEANRRRKVLSRDSLTAKIRVYFETKIQDTTKPGSPFSLTDCLMSGLAIFLFKYPSLLRFEGAYGDKKSNSNLKRILKLGGLPSDTSVRYHLDKVKPESLKPLFKDIFNELRRNADLSDYRLSDGSYLISIDGTNVFSSKKVSCKSCLVKNHRNGSKTYYHQIMTAVLISPTSKAVFPIDLEEISNKDGSSKNDCELNATSRLLKRLRETYPGTKFTVTADGLSSNTPNIELMRQLDFNYILVAKDGNHKHLVAQNTEKMERCELESYKEIDDKGIEHTVTCHPNAELNQTHKTNVNYLCYWTEDSNGKQLYYNTWVTNFDLNEQAVFEISRAGRTYWRIENETHNTLKNQGYNLEHNYGHGEENLCSVFTHLTLLAFLVDQINLSCPRLAYLATKLKSKVAAFEQVMVTLYSDVIESFDELYNIAAERFGDSLNTS